MKTAVLLVSMGGPASLDAVRPFLFNLFSDPAIIRLPSFLRLPLAFFLSAIRERKAQNIYAQMGGRSPILENTKAQAVALQAVLSSFRDYKVYVGMSYSPPQIQDVLKEITKENPEKLIVVPLYPQYSTTTTASVIKEISDAPLPFPVRFIETFFDEDGFIQALSSSIKPVWEEACSHGTPYLLLTAHGIPERLVAAGDPYPRQCQQTAEKVVELLGIPKTSWMLCYQSRLGPVKWTKPYTDQEIIKLAQERKALVIASISFVCEHSETLVELGMTYRDLAQKNGARFYGLAPTVGTDPNFIKALARLITEN